MKKLLFLTALLMLTAIQAFALEACDLKFTPAGGGKYIYANNPEAIHRGDLADKSNPTPVYLMNNENMGQGKYSLFLSHLNHTDILDTYGRIAEPGFDIEADILFVAKSDMKLRVNAAGFEIISKNAYYEDGTLVKYNESWSCLNAWSSYLQMPIYQKNGTKYQPGTFSPVTKELKKGEKFWLSSITPGYKEVPFLMGVHMLADFEILSGSADINAAALRYTGTLKDRSQLASNIAFGEYARDKQYKGVADTLPRMNASLSYTIDESVESGTLLPVTVYNQYNLSGNKTTWWMTNINPQADIWSRNICTESDMLSLKYPDKSKLQFYGTQVATKEKDAVWVFDPFHSDTRQYSEEFSRFTSLNYKPNYSLVTNKDELDFACNLGNYGVSLFYKVTIDNKGAKDRHVNYHLNTSSANIIIMRDENEKPVGDYAICKGNTHQKNEETLATVTLPAKKKTTFVLQIILPTNAAGGMENALEISDSAAVITIPEMNREVVSQRYIYTGKEYLKWEAGVLYSTTDFASWTKMPSSPIANELFDGNWNDYDIKAIDGGYMVRWATYDGAPSIYDEAKDFYNKVYFFDEKFHLMARPKFTQIPTDMSFAEGNYFVMAGDCFTSGDMTTWKKFAFSAPPVSNGSFSAAMKDKALYISVDGQHYFKSTYQPKYMAAVQGAFYYSDKNRFFVSSDATYWKEYTLDKPVETVERAGEKLLVNKKAFDMPEGEKNIWVKLTGEVLAFDTPPVMENGRVLVPLRLLFEKLGCIVSWDEETRTVTAVSKEHNISFSVDSEQAYVDGNAITLDTPARQFGGRTFAPLRFLSEQLGYKVSWDGVYLLVDIEKK